MRSRRRRGRYFTTDEDDRKANRCILGAGIATDLFGTESAIGQTVTVDSTKLTVIGVMEPKEVSSQIQITMGASISSINLLPKRARLLTPRRRRPQIYLKLKAREQIDSIIAQTTALLPRVTVLIPLIRTSPSRTQQDIIATKAHHRRLS
ncbi:MAG: ABC transporter permease [Anaerolineales bacterium]|nr:ABC transporter permease [Anaerolineales bacterium]